ncbi:MAG: selenium cofactor biosynthesis protein YqeC [Chloroflexota bacterium]
MEIKFSAALRLSTQGATSIAFAGAGGKTSAVFALARQCGQAFVTTTTHLGNWQAALADRHLVLEPDRDISTLVQPSPAGVVLVTGPATAGKRLAGVDVESLDALRRLALACQIPLLIEADGARQRPLKAPAEYEPAIPAFVGVVVLVAGLSALGQPLAPDCVHRPERFAALAKLQAGQPITPESVARLLSHPQGGLKAIPPGAHRVCLLTQAQSSDRQAAAGWIAGKLSASFDATLIAAAQPDRLQACFESTAGVVLAAGAATRYGEPKQLLDWRGEPLVRRAARTAIDAGLSPAVVVTGAHADSVRAAVAGLDVTIVHCPDWAEGQAASIRAGLRTAVKAARLPGSAIFLLADQPYVTAVLLRALCERHANTLAPIVAPLADGRRGNPVLFDRSTFPALLALRGDVGGRALFSCYRIEWLPWHDPQLLLDVDTPDDYRKLIGS